MRGSVAKNIRELVPENPPQPFKSTKSVGKWKKRFWNGLNCVERGKRSAKLS
jgi:hypothetical protein